MASLDNIRLIQVRDELEHLLDDDEDMAEMYLTEKLEQQLDDASSSTFVNDEDVDEEILQTEIDDRFLSLLFKKKIYIYFAWCC